MARSIQKLTENRATVAAPLLTITAIALFFTAPASIIAAGPGSLDTGMVVVFWTPFSLVAAILAGIVAFFPPGNTGSGFTCAFDRSSLLSGTTGDG